jgi:hypothetical protein
MRRKLLKRRIRIRICFDFASASLPGFNGQDVSIVAGAGLSVLALDEFPSWQGPHKNGPLPGFLHPYIEKEPFKGKAQWPFAGTSSP